MNTSANLSIYRCYRSAALWFASRIDGYSITVDKGRTYHFDKGESLEWAKKWMTKARKTWHDLSEEQKQQLATCQQLGVRDVAVGPNGAKDFRTTTASIVDSHADPECLCPDCADNAIKYLGKIAAQTWTNLVFPGKDTVAGMIQYDDEEPSID